MFETVKNEENEKRKQNNKSSGKGTNTSSITEEESAI